MTKNSGTTLLKFMRDNQKTIRLGLMFSAFALALATTPALAQTAPTPTQVVTITGGADQAANMTSLYDMGATSMGFLMNVVAKLVGVVLAIWAIFDFVKRDILWGVVKLLCSGACFFLPKLIAALASF